LTRKCRISSHDLWRMSFVSDPRVSPDGSRIVYVETTVVPEKNGYESVLWMAQRENDGTWHCRQFTFPPPQDSPVREHSPRWSPDGQQVSFISNRGDGPALYVIPINGGEARRLLGRKTSISSPAWSPDGSRIAFVSPDPEDLDPDYAAFRGLDTDNDTGRPTWNGEELPVPSTTYVTKLRYKFNGVGFIDDRFRQLFVVDVSTGRVDQLTDGCYNNDQPSWSPDGKQLAFTSVRRKDREHVALGDLWVISAGGDHESQVVEARGPINNPTWSPDGQLIAYLGHEQGEFSAANTRVYIVAPSGGTVRCLTADFDRSVGNSIGSDSRLGEGTAGPFWISGGDELAFVATDRGTSAVYRVNLASGELSRVPMAPTAITSLSVQQTTKPGQLLAVVGESWNHPGDIFATALGPAGEVTGVNRVTEVNRFLTESRFISRPERFEFEAADGRPMEGWVIKPVGFEEDTLYPVVLAIHGGPAGTYGDVYSHEFQLLASRGYGVVFTNPRGSKGYGEAWARGVIGDWGGGDYADLMACVDSAVEQFAWIDPDRLGVTGGSYGGYMTNWIVSQTNRFRAAVTMRSISNLYTKYGVSDIGFFGNRAGMGGADLWDEEDFIMSRSPIRYAPNVRTPLLIVHSEEDLRCPMEQAEQWYVALRRLGNVEVEFIRFAGENHELSRSGKPVNRVERLERLVDWFDRHIAPTN